MASLQSTDHLKKICLIEGERLTSLNTFLKGLESISCCDDARRSIEVLQRLTPNISESLDNQIRKVEALEFGKKETYEDKDIRSYIHAGEYLRSLSRASGYLYNHILAGQDKRCGKEIHAIQMLLHECGLKMNHIRNAVRPIYVTVRV